jgi:hypothetical protein
LIYYILVDTLVLFSRSPKEPEGYLLGYGLKSTPLDTSIVWLIKLNNLDVHGLRLDVYLQGYPNYDSIYLKKEASQFRLCLSNSIFKIAFTHCVECLNPLVATRYQGNFVGE